jgi:tRNA pseudouridine38-40 synthase
LRYFFHIGYNGFNYNGWQKLPQNNSVQLALETQLSLILKTPLTIVGCGRTDAQVHAGQFFFHVDIDLAWDFDLMYRLNKNLPPDIAIFDIIAMDDQAHARFDATVRTYDYFIHRYKDPFLSTLSSLYLEKDLDLQKMKKAVALLPRYNDYRAFCKNPALYRTTICQVSAAELFVNATGDRLRFSISANRFLGGMIRIIVYKLLQIGEGQFGIEEFEHYLSSGETIKTIKPAYPQGLYLSKVVYPFLDLPSRTQFLNPVLHEAGDWLIV